MSTPATWAMFCQNTGLRVRSNDTMYFASSNARYTWFYDKAITIGSTKILTGLSYQRVENGGYKMRVPAPRQTIEKCDYMVFHNAAHENHDVYAFISDVDYVNEEMCEVYFIEDVFQTWIDSTTFKKSMISRRTVDHDIIFDLNNDVPDFITGDYHTVYKGNLALTYNTQARYIVLHLSGIYVLRFAPGDPNIPVDEHGWPDIKSEVAGITNKITWPYANAVGNQPDMTFYWIADYNDAYSSSYVLTLARELLTYYSGDSSTGNPVLSCFMCPESCIPDDALTQLTAGKPTLLVAAPPSGSTDTVPNHIDSHDTISATVAYAYGFLGTYRSEEVRIPWTGNSGIKQWLFDGYQPVNKKLYSAPYWKLRIKNNAGQYIDLSPQFLVPLDDVQSESDYVFGGVVCSVFSEYPFVAFFPSYDKSDRNTSYKLALIPPPHIPLKADAFGSWFTQMKIALPSTIAKTAVSAGLAVASGGASEMMSLASINPASKSAGFAIASTMERSDISQRMAGLYQGSGILNSVMDFATDAYRAKTAAPIVSGETAADYSTLALSDDQFTFEVLSLTEGDAKICDDYLTANGYSVGRFESPDSNNTFYSLNGRPFFTFIKTVNAVACGNIPLYAAQGISDILNSGVRIWNPDFYLNYNVDNTPL